MLQHSQRSRFLVDITERVANANYATDDDEMDRYAKWLMLVSYWMPGGWRQNQHRWSVHENQVLTKASQRHEGSNRNRRDEMMSKDTPSKWHEKKSELSTVEKKKHKIKRKRDQ